MAPDDIELGVRELQLKVAVNRVKDVRYLDWAGFIHNNWLPVPPHSWLVDEADLDA